VTAVAHPFFGVVEALVEENVGDPGKEGRVKVRFPWYSDDTVTEWCRVAQLYAGNGYGSCWVPEKGDEVLVAFVHGDMNRPIVLGGLYNGVDKPPTSRERDEDRKLLRTRAGHQLLLEDTADARKIQLTTAGGHTLELDDQGQKVALRTSQGHALTLDDGGQAITLETSGGQTITLDGASGTVTVKATSVQVQASTVAIQASTVELGSPAREPALLGATFAALFAAHTHMVGPIPTTPPVVPVPPTALSTQVIVG
jgi:uncharacterized protein involved in type VI secretion and phage assembly